MVICAPINYIYRDMRACSVDGEMELFIVEYTDIN